ncbi:hypothetical protein [Stutzerimonas chloritidismutans]|uniref:hypothetical protein n=1 Tax=Stutzerimonas chloritidismutans TaxID=203192 RepID=UPI0028A616F7|nr:hypothetical protein [Stutzerimonas chloritidismutans]
MWARIENGTVVEIAVIDPRGRFHPSLQWQSADQADGCSPGWLWNGKTFAAPAIPPEPPQARVQVETLRLRAYADPLTGSDRHFAEAQRESLMGNHEAAEAAKVAGMLRFAEIQAEYPWPEN